MADAKEPISIEINEPIQKHLITFLQDQNSQTFQFSVKGLPVITLVKKPQ